MKVSILCVVVDIVGYPRETRLNKQPLGRCQAARVSEDSDSCRDHVASLDRVRGLLLPRTSGACSSSSHERRVHIDELH